MIRYKTFLGKKVVILSEEKAIFFENLAKEWKYFDREINESVQNIELLIKLVEKQQNKTPSLPLSEELEDLRALILSMQEEVGHLFSDTDRK